MILLKRKSTDVSPLNPLDSIKPVQSPTRPCTACRPAATLTSSPSLPAPLAQFPQVTGGPCSVAEPQALAPRFLRGAVPPRLGCSLTSCRCWVSFPSRALRDSPQHTHVPHALCPLTQRIKSSVNWKTEITQAFETGGI